MAKPSIDAVLGPIVSKSNSILRNHLETAFSTMVDPPEFSEPKTLLETVAKLILYDMGLPRVDGKLGSEFESIKDALCLGVLWKDHPENGHILLECMHSPTHPKYYYELPRYLNYCLHACKPDLALMNYIRLYAPLLLYRTEPFQLPSNALLCRLYHHLYLRGETVVIEDPALDLESDYLKIRSSLTPVLSHIFRPQRKVPYHQWIDGVLADVRTAMCIVVLVLYRRHAVEPIGIPLMNQCLSQLAKHVH